MKNYLSISFLFFIFFTINSCTRPCEDLKGLVSEMVAADLELFHREKLLKDSGYTIKNQFE